MVEVLGVTGYGLRVTGYGLRVTGYGLRVKEVASYGLHTSYGFLKKGAGRRAK